MDPGICGTCRHAREVVTGKGSRFTMCGRAAGDPRYPKYPALPVRVCPGHEEDEAPPEGPDSASGGGR